MAYCTNEHVRFSWMDCRHPFIPDSKLWHFASIEGAVIGTCSVDFFSDDFAWINNLFVLEGFRMEGIAKELIMRASDHASQLKKLRGISAGINRANKESQHIFEKLGFVHVYSYPDSDALLFTKLISK